MDTEFPGCEPFDTPADENPAGPSPLGQALQEFAGKCRVVPAKWRRKAEEFEDDFGLATVKRALTQMKTAGQRWGHLGWTVMAIVKEAHPEPGRGVVQTRTPGASSPKSNQALADEDRAREKRADLQGRFDAIPADKLAGLFDRLRAANHMLNGLEVSQIIQSRGWVGKYLPAVVAMHEGETE